MQRRDPYIIHFQEFQNLEQDCYQLLGGGEIMSCIKKLKTYLVKRNYREKLGMMNKIELRYNENRSFYNNTLIDLESYNLERNRLHEALIQLIKECEPSDFDKFQQSSLRRQSKWDERNNLTIFLQFDRDARLLGQILKELVNSEKWKPFIPQVQYFMEDSFEKTNWVQVPDNLDQENLSEEEKSKISEKEPLFDDFTVILEDIVIEEFLDDYDKPQNQNFIAQAIIEIQEQELQIWISAVGEPKLKCRLFNEILLWFEKYIADKNLAPFSVSIPQAFGFHAFEESANEISISMKQPI